MMPVKRDQMNLPRIGTFLGRARSPGNSHPSVVAVRGGDVVDITSKQAPTVRDIREMDDPAGYVSSARGEAVGSVEVIAANSRALQPLKTNDGDCGRLDLSCLDTAMREGADLVARCRGLDLFHKRDFLQIGVRPLIFTEQSSTVPIAGDAAEEIGNFVGDPIRRFAY